MRWVLLGILILISPGIFAWYQEYGNDISGSGAFDTSGRQPVLIVFKRADNCSVADIWLDASLHERNISDNSAKPTSRLQVDGYSGWLLSLENFETNYWLPGTLALRQSIPTHMLRQFRFGKELSIYIEENRFTWSLKGSNLAIATALNNCLK